MKSKWPKISVRDLSSEAAALFGISERTLQHRIEDGIIKPKKVIRLILRYSKDIFSLV